MQRIDVATAASTLPAPAAAGTPGFWQKGDPSSGTPATILDADFFNGVQEELIAIILAAGLTPSKTTLTQLRDAIKRIAGPQSIVTVGQGVTLAANTTYNATCAPFTAPVNGIIRAAGGINVSAPGSGLFTCSLIVNTTTVSSDITALTQFHEGELAVTAGTVVTIKTTVVTTGTSPAVPGTIRAGGMFIPT